MKTNVMAISAGRLSRVRNFPPRRGAFDVRLARLRALWVSRQSVPATRQPFVLQLDCNETMRLEKSCGAQNIEVRRGTVWLTGTPAAGDVLLQPGDTFPLAKHWPFVIQALEEAEVVLQPAAESTDRDASLPS